MSAARESRLSRQLQEIYAFIEQNQQQRAISVATSLLHGFPESALLHLARGTAFFTLNNLQQALDDFNKAVQLDSKNAEAYFRRGLVLHVNGQLEVALEEYNCAIKFNKSFAEAYSNRGIVLAKLGRYQRAIENYNRAIDLDSTFADAYSNRGIAQLAIGNTQEATEDFKQAIRLKPEFSMAHNNLCDTYEKNNQIDLFREALGNAQKLLSESDPVLLFHRAQLASRERRYENALALLEQISPLTLELQVRQKYTELLAKTLDRLGQYGAAFTQFEMANVLSRQLYRARSADADRYLNYVHSLLQSWSQNNDSINWSVNHDLDDQLNLVFLVGFPRSGTTLLDTVLRTHDEIQVIEERPMVNVMNQQLGSLASVKTLEEMSDSQCAILRQCYFDELKVHLDERMNTRVIVDKLPLNIIHIGLIHRVFPQARFVLALRHPCDCVLSCFMQSFDLNDSMANFLELNQSARFYDVVMKLWVQYTQTLQLNVYTLKYEQMVQDLRATIEPLLSFLGLSWQDGLQEYRDTALARRVSTPSYNQVTQSLYTRSIDRWQNYAQQMQDVLPVLEPWIEYFGYAKTVEPQDQGRNGAEERT